jgi:hypothetical protein
MKRILWSGAGISTALSLILAVGLSIAASVEVQVAVLVGLLSTLIGMAITAFIAIEEHLERIDCARIGALPLQRLFTIPTLERTVVRAVDAAATTTEERGPFMESLARETLEHALERLEDIADGVAACESSDELRLVRRALDHCSHQVRAVAARGTDWWRRPEADLYWRAYGSAAARLSIERIFVLRSDIDEQMQQVLVRHHRLGMKTYVVRAEQLPEERIEPLVIFDQQIVHRHAAQRQSGDRYRIEFSTRPDDILRAEENFLSILDVAEEWTPPPTVASVAPLPESSSGS